MSERSGLVGGRGCRSLWQKCISDGDVKVLPPYGGRNSASGWGLTKTIEFSLQGDGTGKIHPEFKAGIALKGGDVL